MSKTVFQIRISTPVGTTGAVGLPLPGNGTHATLSSSGGKKTSIRGDDSGRFWVEGVAGGEHEFIVVAE